MSKSYVEIPDVKCLRDTEKALLCRTDAGDEVWVPKSVVDENNSEVSDVGDEGVLVLEEWFAKKEDDLRDYVE